MGEGAAAPAACLPTAGQVQHLAPWLDQLEIGATSIGGERPLNDCTYYRYRKSPLIDTICHRPTLGPDALGVGCGLPLPRVLT